LKFFHKSKILISVKHIIVKRVVDIEMFRKKSNKIVESYAHLGIIKKCEGANFFGQESLGVRQVRGNGVLLLTNDELIFEYWVPKRILRIPISKIHGLEQTKWHLKKTKGVNLLKVRFTNKENEEDSGAWWVTDIEDWNKFLESLINKK